MRLGSWRKPIVEGIIGLRKYLGLYSKDSGKSFTDSNIAMIL